MCRKVRDVRAIPITALHLIWTEEALPERRFVV
jgi:hypothetical protein